MSGLVIRYEVCKGEDICVIREREYERCRTEHDTWINDMEAE